MRFLALLIAFFGVCLTPAYGFVEKRDKTIVTDQLLEKNQKISQKYPFEFQGKTFIGYPNVYSPLIFPGSSKQSDLNIRPGDAFLEIGCGTGIFSILAAVQGAERVVTTDINPDAIANTLENAKLYNVDSRVTTLQGDMFQPLPEGSLFDVIFFNAPYCHREASRVNTFLEKSLFDPEHRLLHWYLKEGKKYLKPEGRLVLGYSTTHGDIEAMHQWAKEYGWATSLLYKSGDEKVDFITVELYEFRPLRTSSNKCSIENLP